MSEYTSPVDKLLTIGKPDVVEVEGWPDYLALGLTPEHIPDLLRLVTDRSLLTPDNEEQPEGWAALHALRTLGQLRDMSALEPLLEASEFLLDDEEGLGEWALEELPEVYALLGPQGIPALTTLLATSSRDLYARSCAAEGLTKIAEKYPEYRQACIEALTQTLTVSQDAELNGFLIIDLVKLKAVETAPVIEQSFLADKVDTMIVGDWDDVQVELGLKEAEPRSAASMTATATSVPPLSGAGKYKVKPRRRGSNAMSKKDKVKMSKMARKKNKKKH